MRHIIFAAVGAGIGGFAWHAYHNQATGQGAPLDRNMAAALGGGALVGVGLSWLLQ